MAQLDPNTQYEEGQLVYFNALPPTKYNPNCHTIQGAEFYTADPIKPMYGALVSAVNPWAVPSAVYMKGYRLAIPNNINGVTVPSGSTEFSAVCKAWWQAIQGAVDGTDVLEAKFPTYDTLVDLNGIGDAYHGYDIDCTPVWFADYYNPQYPKWGIRINCRASFIEPTGGGDFISLDLESSTERNYRIVAVVFDTLDRTETTIRSRKGFWCIINSSNKVIKSIAWQGGVFYDSQSDIETEGEPMLEPDLPSLDIMDTGMTKMYVFETQTELNSLFALSEFLWSDDFLEALVKTVDNPMDAIISFNGVPFSDSLQTSATSQVAVGNLYIPDCYTRKVSKQYARVDCGRLSIPATHGNYLDYEPYTEIRLFLPYIGFVSLSCADAVGKELDIAYHCDIITGQCVAYVKDGTTGNVLYTYNGNCLQNLPMTGRNLPNMLTGILSATGIPTDLGSKGIAGFNSVMGAVSGGLQGVQGQYTRGGGINFTSGLMAPQRPYAIVTRRVPIVDANYNTYVGQPYFKTAQLSSVSGFTIVEQVQLSGIVATQGELDEIERLLKEGVIL